jgi:hypothetical protein
VVCVDRNFQPCVDELHQQINGEDGSALIFADANIVAQIEAVLG